MAAPARADRFADGGCDPEAGTCEVSAGLDASTPGNGANGGGGATAADGDSADLPWVSDPGVPDQEVCETWIEETDLDFFIRAGERPSDEHQLMHTSCKYPDGTGSIESEWVEIDEDGNPIIDPAVLAQRAVDSLRLPTPRIGVSPREFQLVQLPTWLWLDGDSWTTQSASASVPGLTVTATATPVAATWDMGDGSTVTCASAGVKWAFGSDAKSASPSCGHTYTRTSAGASGGEFVVAVTVVWVVSWSGGGVSGSEPDMTSTAQTSWPVVQSPALVK